MQCEAPTPIPSQLTKPLSQLREVPSDATIYTIMETQKYNAEQCGVCYVRYENLMRAVDQRQEDK